LGKGRSSVVSVGMAVFHSYSYVRFLFA
jgi:hypothetical protein